MLNLVLNRKIKRFINFNKIYFKNEIEIKNNSKILCEFTNNNSNIVAFSYLNYVLKKKYNCKSFGYINLFKKNYFDILKLSIKKFIGYKFFGLYKSFLIDDFIIAFQNNETQKKVKDYLDNDFQKIKSKKDLLFVKINDVLIGDYIYDSYLKENKLPTISNFNDKKFLDFFKKSLNSFYFWEDYFKKNKVVAVILSHTVYADSIIARIASSKNITSYQCNWHNIQKIKKDRINAYIEFKTFRNDFSQLSNENKEIAIKKTKLEIEKRLNLGIGFDNLNINNPSFSKNFSVKRIIENSNKKKILISSHCFLDAPHSYGPEGDIFEDYYTWLDFLYNFSKETKYDWYIKSHPNQMPYSNVIMKNFLENRKNFRFVSPSVSNLQLIKEGVDCVLTVNGTVGWEFAYFGVPVINASVNNPHISYNFNLHPRNLSEYKKMILNFSNYKIDFDKKKIIEYYFMKNIYTKSNWMLENYFKTIKDINGYENLKKFEFYEYWIKNFSKQKFDKILSVVNNHISSSDNYLKNSSFLN